MLLRTTACRSTRSVGVKISAPQQRQFSDGLVKREALKRISLMGQYWAEGPAKAAPTKVTQTPGLKVPLCIPTTAGSRALSLLHKMHALGGLPQAERFYQELEVFVRSVDGEESWSSLVNACDEVFHREDKNVHLILHMHALALSKVFMETMLVLFNSKDIVRLNQILADYAAYLRAVKREVNVKIVTKEPLDKLTTEFLKNTVSLNFLEPEDTMIFSSDVDSSIVSGYKVYINGTLHDYTPNKVLDAEAAATQQAGEALRNEVKNAQASARQEWAAASHLFQQQWAGRTKFPEQAGTSFDELIKLSPNLVAE